LYRLFQAAELMRCNPWELAEQPECWQEWAFWFHDVRRRVQDGLAEVARQRDEYEAQDYE
jgi:broad specificity phosphatase PhoE